MGVSDRMVQTSLKYLMAVIYLALHNNNLYILIFKDTDAINS